MISEGQQDKQGEERTEPCCISLQSELAAAKEQIAALEEKERDWDKNPYGYLQDSPLWNNTIDQYRAIIEKLQAQISTLQSSRLKDIEDAWVAGCAYGHCCHHWPKDRPEPPNKASYLKQFTDKT